MNNQLTLLELLREQKKKKNRPLKVICDWDECLKPLRPAAVYKFLPENNDKISFKDFFKNFWERIVATDQDSGFKVHGYEGSEEEKKALEDWRQMRKKRESDVKNYNVGNFYSSPERFKAPWLSIAEELLGASKEGLISELKIISSVRKKGFDSENKERIFKETFGKFPGFGIMINEFKRLPFVIDGREVASHPEGKVTPARYEVIRDKFPDFDVYIDDDSYKLTSARAFFGSEKIYVLPDYKYSRNIQAPNIYHVKTTVSDIKNEDFTIAALEMKTEELEKKLKAIKSKESKISLWKQPNTYLVFISGVSLTLLVVFLIMAVRKKRK